MTGTTALLRVANPCLLIPVSIIQDQCRRLLQRRLLAALFRICPLTLVKLRMIARSPTTPEARVHIPMAIHMLHGTLSHPSKARWVHHQHQEEWAWKAIITTRPAKCPALTTRQLTIMTEVIWPIMPLLMVPIAATHIIRTRLTFHLI